jgi:hypothetical protein
MLSSLLHPGVVAALGIVAAALAGALVCFPGRLTAEVSVPVTRGDCTCCGLQCLCDTSATNDAVHMITITHLHASFHRTDDSRLCMPSTPQVELGEQLSQAGTLGSSSSLSAALTSLLGGKAALGAIASQGSSSSSGAAPLPQPTEAVLLAFIVAVALAELSRTALAPLPDLGAPRQLCLNVQILWCDLALTGVRAARQCCCMQSQHDTADAYYFLCHMTF